MTPVYHFDRLSGQFTASGFGVDCQVEPGMVLLPAFSTLKVTPTAPTGQAAFFDIDADDWEVRELVPAPVVPEPPPAAELTLQERQALLEDAVDLHLDGQARALGYAGIATAVSYAEEDAVPKFQVEGRALRRWRSLVYATCYELLNAFKAGELEEPTVESLIDALPGFEMPDAEGEAE